MGNYHVLFWRAVEGATPSLTLIMKSSLFMTILRRGHLNFSVSSQKLERQTPSTVRPYLRTFEMVEVISPRCGS